MQQAYKQVDALNVELQEKGLWCSAATARAELRNRRARHRRRPINDRRSLRGDEGALGGFWILELPDLDAALPWATGPPLACMVRRGRPFQDEPPAA